jgi:hypothetical protein
MAAERTLDPRDAALAGLLASYRRERTEAWLTTHGTSMQPLIKPGSRVLIEFGARPAIGEVVVFSSSGGYVAHRVVGRYRDTARALLIVKGDAEPYPDRALEPAEILGVVRAVRWPAEDRPRVEGLGGRSGRVLAATSLWSGRAARIGRRLVARAPRQFRTAGLRSIASFARVPTRLVMAPITLFGAERR